MSQIKSVFWKRSLLTTGLLAVSGAALITYLFQPQPLDNRAQGTFLSDDIPFAPTAMAADQNVAFVWLDPQDAAWQPVRYHSFERNVRQ